MKMPRITKKMRDTFKTVMREIGKKGGKNSRKNLTPEERKALAQKAAAARWKK